MTDSPSVSSSGSTSSITTKNRSTRKHKQSSSTSSMSIDGLDKTKFTQLTQSGFSSANSSSSPSPHTNGDHSNSARLSPLPSPGRSEIYRDGLLNMIGDNFDPTNVSFCFNCNQPRPPYETLVEKTGSKIGRLANETSDRSIPIYRKIYVCQQCSEAIRLLKGTTREETPLVNICHEARMLFSQCTLVSK